MIHYYITQYASHITLFKVGVAGGNLLGDSVGGVEGWGEQEFERLLEELLSSVDVFRSVNRCLNSSGAGSSRARSSPPLCGEDEEAATN